MIAKAGWSKEDIRNFIYEKARISMAEAEAAGIKPAAREWAQRLADVTDESTLVPITARPEDLVIVVAGATGANNSTFVPCILRRVTGGLDKFKPAKWKELIRTAREELSY